MVGSGAWTKLAGRARSRGATSIEYALLLVAIAGVVVGVVFLLSQPIEQAFQNLIDQFTSQTSSPSSGGGGGGSNGGSGGNGGGGSASATPSPTPTPTPTPSPSPTP